MRVLGPLASSNRAAWVSRPIVPQTTSKPQSNGVGDLPFSDSREFPKLGEVPPPLPKSAKRQQSQGDDRPESQQPDSTEDTEWQVVDHAEAEEQEEESPKHDDAGEHSHKRPLSDEQALQFEAVLTEPPEKRSKAASSPLPNNHAEPHATEVEAPQVETSL